MTALKVFEPVDVSHLPEYPIGPDQRLDSHGFIQWEYRRWISSDMRWNASHECKSIWFELVNIAHGETPVGTLPADPRRLARMVVPVIDPDHFENLCRMEFGPLHGWERCCVEDDVRLMHPVVTRIVTSALASRANAQARTDAASHVRRLKRLTEDVAALAPAISEDPVKVRWIDMHLQELIEERGGSRRTPEDLHRAIQACVQRDRDGRFAKPPQ